MCSFDVPYLVWELIIYITFNLNELNIKFVKLRSIINENCNLMTLESFHCVVKILYIHKTLVN
jgi:hypothetical protein